MGPQEIQQNAAAAHDFLQDIEWDDEDMAQPMDADDLSWKEPRKGSARWFATRKDQPVFSGIVQRARGPFAQQLACIAIVILRACLYMHVHVHHLGVHKWQRGVLASMAPSTLAPAKES